MLRDPTPQFMLDTIRELRNLRLCGESLAQTSHLETNIRWLITGEGRPVGCPGGYRQDRFLARLEGMREECVERLQSLRLNEEYSIFDVLYERVMSGVEGVRSYDEIAFNNTLSSHFERHEDDHALIRWLVEGEFLETETSDRPDRTIGLDEIIVEDLPLHISSNWAAHGRDGPGTMGPTARLLCYWVRGEYLGSCSVTDLEFVEEHHYHRFNVRHEANVMQRLEGERTVRRQGLRRRIRMHALSKIDVFTLIPRDGVFERWVLRDSSVDRYQHGLSESLMPGENFTDCARRGLEEELGIERSRIENSVVPYGPTRVEWGTGLEGFDSSSMPGLPSIMCINPFYVEFDVEDDSDLIELDDNRIPTRQFVIEDAGGTTLNWLPEAIGLNLKETLGYIEPGEDFTIQTNQWYALNYPALPSSEKAKKEQKIITAMIGTTLLYHLPDNNQPFRLIGPPTVESGEGSESTPLLYTNQPWSRNATKGRLGISSFVRRTNQVNDLLKELITNNIVESIEGDDFRTNCKSYLSSIGRLFQPEIEGQIASQWLVEHISSARSDLNLSRLSSEGILSLLPWEPEFTLSPNADSGNLETVDQRENRRQNAIRRWQRALNRLFDIITDEQSWQIPETLSELLQNQPQFDGLRQIILFKTLDDGSYQVKLRKDVNLPLAQLHSNLLNHLRRRENQQPGDNILDDDTHGRILGTVNELRERQAMIVRLD